LREAFRPTRCACSIGAPHHAAWWALPGRQSMMPRRTKKNQFKISTIAALPSITGDGNEPAE
jgi:hypothetical protein